MTTSSTRIVTSITIRVLSGLNTHVRTVCVCPHNVKQGVRVLLHTSRTMPDVSKQHFYQVHFRFSNWSSTRPPHIQLTILTTQIYTPDSLLLDLFNFPKPDYEKYFCPSHRHLTHRHHPHETFAACPPLSLLPRYSHHIAPARSPHTLSHFARNSATCQTSCQPSIHSTAPTHSPHSYPPSHSTHRVYPPPSFAPRTPSTQDSVDTTASRVENGFVLS